MNHQYDDMLGMEHHVSGKRPQMSRIQRAAQFAPFAALTGFDRLIGETSRVTHERVALSEEEQAILNIQLNRLAAMSGRHPMIGVTYFVPDPDKPGGCYRTEKCILKKVNADQQSLAFEDGMQIAFTDLLVLELPQNDSDEEYKLMQSN